MKPRCDPTRNSSQQMCLKQKVRLLFQPYRACRRHKREPDAASRDEVPRHWWRSVPCSLAIIAGLTLSAQAATPGVFDQANEDFAAGRFTKAAQGFEQVVSQQGYSAPVLFDLGNAWLKAGQPGRAILNYERALVLAPGDQAITRNLRLAREQAGLTAPETSAAAKVVDMLSWNALVWIGVGALVVLCAMILAGRIRPAWPRTVLRTLSAGSVITLMAVVAALAFRWPELDRAVILTAETPARIAPAEAAGVSFKLPAGEIVHAERSHGDFTLVRTADGQAGWVSDVQVAKVMVPGHAKTGFRTKSTATKTT